MSDPTKLPGAATAAMMAALGVGTLLLFHFTQVFPGRRPWIKNSGAQMAIAYALIPLAIVGLLRFMPDSADKVTVPYILALLVFGFPLLVLLVFVLPVAGIVSLFRSYRDVRESPHAYLKGPLEWILLSQIAGGTLAILFAPVLAVLAPNSLLLSVLTVLIWALGLMTPIAFAIAVFRFNVLALRYSIKRVLGFYGVLLGSTGFVPGFYGVRSYAISVSATPCGEGIEDCAGEKRKRTVTKLQRRRTSQNGQRDHYRGEWNDWTEGHDERRGIDHSLKPATAEAEHRRAGADIENEPADRARRRHRLKSSGKRERQRDPDVTRMATTGVRYVRWTSPTTPGRSPCSARAKRLRDPEIAACPCCSRSQKSRRQA